MMMIEKNNLDIADFVTQAGMLSTDGGLVFTGRMTGEFIAIEEASGKVLWRFQTGSGGHLAVELIQVKTGIKVVHISYKGAGPALIGVIGGNAHLLFAGPGVFMPHLKAGRVRALAIGSLQRIPILPEVPTLNESGLPGMESGSWHGLVAPAGTPAQSSNSCTPPR